MNVKVRCFSGSTIYDIYYYIAHVGTNDTPYKSSEEVLVELLQLKDHIESILPSTTVIV